MTIRHTIFYKFAIFLGFFLSTACTKQIQLTDWASGDPQSTAQLYSPILTSGDVLEIRFYITASLQNQAYRLGVGDVIRVDIDKFTELTREKLTILPDGSISLPLIGEVNVEKSTTEEAAKLITERYAKKGLEDPMVVVSVIQDQQRLRSIFDSRLPSSVGESLQIPIFEGMPISLPIIGSINIDRSLQEVEAEIAAKYFDEFGKQLNVVVNVKQREAPTLTVLGEVKKPGKIKLTNVLSPIEAIAEAGGYTDAADLKRVAVIRFARNQPYQRWLFNLHDDMNNVDAMHHKFKLGKDDVVLVVKTDVADLNLWVAQYLRNNLPIQSYIGGTIPLGP